MLNAVEIWSYDKHTLKMGLWRSHRVVGPLVSVKIFDGLLMYICSSHILCSSVHGLGSSMDIQKHLCILGYLITLSVGSSV